MNFRDETRLEFVNVENKFRDSEDDEENTWKTVYTFIWLQSPIIFKVTRTEDYQDYSDQVGL